MSKLYVVKGDNFSKYTRNKLINTSQGWGFARILEERMNKLIIEVYYLDFFFPASSVNYISTEVVDKEDVHVLDWEMVKSMYKDGVKYVVENYLEINNICYIQKVQNGYGIFDMCDNLLIKYDDWFKMHELCPDWMIEQVDNGKFNF